MKGCFAVCVFYVVHGHVVPRTSTRRALSTAFKNPHICIIYLLIYLYVVYVIHRKAACGSTCHTHNT